MKSDEVFVQVPTKLAFLGAALGAIVYSGFNMLGYPGKGKIAGFSAMVLVGIFALCRPLWKRQWFMPVFLALVAIHAAAAILLPWPESRYPTLMLAPCAALDFGALALVISIIAKRIAR